MLHVQVLVLALPLLLRRHCPLLVFRKVLVRLHFLHAHGLPTMQPIVTEAMQVHLVLATEVHALTFTMHLTSKTLI